MSFRSFKQARGDVYTNETIDKVEVTDKRALANIRKTLQNNIENAKSERAYHSLMANESATIEDVDKRKKAVEEHMKGFAEAQRKIEQAEAQLKKLQQREDDYNDELRSYAEKSAANRRAYKAAQKAYDDNIYAINQQHQRESTANVQAYRAAKRDFEDRMFFRDATIQQLSRDMEQQRLVAGINGGWINGNIDDYIGNAKESRKQMKYILSVMKRTTDPRQLSRLQQRYREESSKLGNAMQIIEMLKPNGEPLQRMGLENLTSLASRGGWMGERNNTVNYLSKMDEQLQVLRKIDENTQDGMKSIYQ